MRLWFKAGGDFSFRSVSERAADPGSVSTALEQDHEEGFDDDLEIPAEGPVFDIVGIEFDHALIVDFAATSDCHGPVRPGMTWSRCA